MTRDLQRPTSAQVRAADPVLNPWVGANAGSGKTRVLTQRVARLLLAGAEPQKILCLTYTKAAAAEMQNRLFAMLGEWAMAPDDWLASQLTLLEGDDSGTADRQALARARRLFARALETPGGLKIQTIHSFCTDLLRRFPLEAGLSPRFEVIDDRQAALMREHIRTGMAVAAEKGSDDAFDRIAARLNEDHIDSLIGAVTAARDGFPEGFDTRLEAHFGPGTARPPREIAAAALGTLDWEALDRLARVMATCGASDQRSAGRIGSAAALVADEPLKAFTHLHDVFLTAAGTRRKSYPTKAVAAAWGDATDLCERMADWCEATATAIREAGIAARARDLDAFARAFLGRYEGAKLARGLLDFDDLIERAHALVVSSDKAQWTLYKLDQGIDHVLIDEAQDTSPRQWALIEAITAEFHAGHGARDMGRTLFVVGDEKQSIYSFQGAEPGAFGTTRARLAGRLEGIGRELERPALTTSFRSAPGILTFVDTVFSGDARQGLTVDAEPVTHTAHRETDAARVDLWPLVEKLDDAGDDEWWRPVDRPAPDAPKERLARMLGAEITRMIGTERLPARSGQPGRRVRAGDILVLVTKRDQLALSLIRHLKSLDVPVAGADRLMLSDELAVQDLMALAKVAMTPGDDLSLAALLRSPLCDIDEDGLFRLAHGRTGTLWEQVIASGLPEAAMLRDMADRADYLRPYEFLERALIHHDGRRRLIARLGLEAEDPIDELLAQALAFERVETPSLAGFIDWIEGGEIVVKREMDAGQDAVRVMTVHGAKGLEAPVVILPDTTSNPHQRDRGPLLLRAGEEGNRPPLMLWAGRTGDDDELLRDLRQRRAGAIDAEWMRLLYVALTRAEDWLILCGAGSRTAADKGWYGLLERALATLPTSDIASPEGLPAPIRRFADDPVPVTGLTEDEAVQEPQDSLPLLPAWIGPAPREERPRRLAPSGLAEHVALGGEGRGREAALTHGNAVHRLLEILPDAPADERDALARRLIAAEFPGLDPAEAIAEAAEVLAAPFASRVFGPGSLAEAGIALAPPAPGPAMIGRIDRLVPGPASVLIVDFKTDARPPAAPRDTPPAYLAQLAAYREGVAALYPGRTVETALLWTRTATLMAVPER